MNDAAARTSSARRERAHVPHARRRRRSSTAIGRRPRRPRAARSCCSIAATSTRAGWRTSSTSSTCRTSTSSRGTRAGTAARPARAATRRASRRRCATCRRSSSTSAREHGIARRGHRASSRRAWARCSSRRGCTTTRRASAAWCSPRRRSRSSSTCRSRAPGLRLMHTLRGNFFVTSYVKAKFLTRDPARIASYDADPLIARAISVTRPARPVRRRRPRRRRRARDHRADAAADLGRRLGRPPRAAARVLRAAGRARSRRSHVLPGFYHDTLGERDRAVAIARVRVVPAAPCSPQPVAQPRPHATPTRAASRARSPTRSPRRCPRCRRAACTGARRARSLRFGGTLSDGVRLGHETGFDSGSTLDYVYRNTASGVTPLGRLDRPQLPRRRSAGAASASASCTSRNCCATRSPIAARAGAPVRIVDIAAGHGRYVLDAIARRGRARCRSCCATTASATSSTARALIRERGLETIATFEHGDAFDRASLAAIAPRPTIGIVSGLYELFPDNAMVRASLAGLADAIAARRPSRLHGPAVASAARAHRARA